jgi:hypothetical protein
MTTLARWIDASVDTIKNSVSCLEEIKADQDKVKIQLLALRRHVDSTLEFLDRKEKFK